MGGKAPDLCYLGRAHLITLTCMRAPGKLSSLIRKPILIIV